MQVRPIHILLVEDNPGDIRLAREAFKEYKIQNTFSVVTDGEEALAYLRRQEPFHDSPRAEIIFLDLNLPKLDGIEVLNEIRKDAALADIPVVILTASALDQQVLRQNDVVADCYVVKPLTADRYLEAIRCFPHLGLSIISTRGNTTRNGTLKSNTV
ncbi:MAG: response regulator [Bryobacteraceae bacterium]